MHFPLKPCEGLFSEETNQRLLHNVDRAQWSLHTCERCGQRIGARFEKGRWLPETHWPSIPRRTAARPHLGAPKITNDETSPREA